MEERELSFPERFDAFFSCWYIMGGQAARREITMPNFIRTTMLMILLMSMAVCAHAQWPLGREMPQGATKSEEQRGPSVTATGRFQIFVSPQAKGYTFMLDTDTGRVWVMKKDSTSGDFSMQRIPVEQVDGGQAGKPAVKEPESGAAKPAGGK
jgi:hypothetical protein